MEVEDRVKAERSNTWAKNWNWAHSIAETKSQTASGNYSQHYHYQLLQKDRETLIHSSLACCLQSLSKSGCTVPPSPPSPPN